MGAFLLALSPQPWNPAEIPFHIILIHNLVYADLFFIKVRELARTVVGVVAYPHFVTAQELVRHQARFVRGYDKLYRAVFCTA